VVASHHTEPKNRPKADMVIQCRQSNVEIGVMECCLPGDTQHFEEDRLKLAKMLKNFVDRVVPFHQKISFIGFQCQGTTTCFYVVYISRP
jgi:hypothetical protein